ncbi:MAG: SGNH/GDSL hydrolase family protein [Nitrospira sp.]|nr:SGNH/GDSL hydrolase family protein [Nitrospira sp.]
MQRLSSPGKRFILLGIFSCMAAVCVAVMAEVGLRVMGYQGAPESTTANIRPIDDPVLNWRYVPSSEVRVGRTRHKYNQAGFLDTEHAIEKPHTIRRVIVVGDSATDAGDAEWEGMFSARLQAGLGRSYEVISIAMGGLNTPQEIHLLEKEGLVYQPDLVVLNFILNDCDFYTEYEAFLHYRAGKDSVIGLLGISIDPNYKRAIKSSALIYFVKQRLENAIGLILGKEETGYIESIWEKPENRRKVTDAFDQLQRLSKESGFPVLIVIWPVLSEFGHYKFQSVHQWIQNVSEKRGFQTLDLLPHFAPNSYRDLQVTAEDNIHPNDRGRKIGVNAVLKWIQSKNLTE